MAIGVFHTLICSRRPSDIEEATMSDKSLGRRDFVKLAAGGGLILPALGARSAAQPAGFPKHRAKKKALFVYGGWEGHEPAKCRDLFVPWISERVRRLGVRHAGALRRRRAHEDDRRRRPGLDNGHDPEGAPEGPARRREGRDRDRGLARRSRRRVPSGDRVPLHGRRDWVAHPAASSTTRST